MMKIAHDKLTLLERIAKQMSSGEIPMYAAVWHEMPGLAYKPTGQPSIAPYMGWSFIPYVAEDNTTRITQRGIPPDEIEFIGKLRPSEESLVFMRDVWDHYFGAGNPRPEPSPALYRDGVPSRVPIGLSRKESTLCTGSAPSPATTDSATRAIVPSSSASVTPAASSPAAPTTSRTAVSPRQPVVKIKTGTPGYAKRTIVNDRAIPAGATAEAMEPKVRGTVVRDEQGNARLVFA